MTVDSIRCAHIVIRDIDGDESIMAATSFDTVLEQPLMRFSVKGETKIDGKLVEAFIPVAISFENAKALGAWLTENVRRPKRQRPTKPPTLDR
jgi:hypothetical protein